MTLKPVLLVGLLLLGACAPLGRPVPSLPERAAGTLPERPSPGQSALNSSVLLAELARVSGLAAEQRRRELAELDSRRLDDVRRFQLALLLEREDSVEALERSLKILTALDALDNRAQALVELLKRSLRTRIELKQQTARTLELQDKLEQIKALEKSLQQRSAPLKTP